MKHVVWAQRAVDDLDLIKARLREIDPDLAKEQLATLVRAARWLLQYPHAGPSIGYRDWRKWRPRSQRYVLLYRPASLGIEVVRIRHEREDWLVAP